VLRRHCTFELWCPVETSIPVGHSSIAFSKQWGSAHSVTNGGQEIRFEDSYVFAAAVARAAKAGAVIPMWLAAPTHMERDDPFRPLPKCHPCASVELPTLRGSPGIVMFKHVNNIGALLSNPGNACYILRNMRPEVCPCPLSKS
jgi:hypothetical protein